MHDVVIGFPITPYNRRLEVCQRIIQECGKSLHHLLGLVDAGQPISPVPVFPLAIFSTDLRLTNFSQGNWDQVFGTNGFTATQARAVCYVPGGTLSPNGASLSLFALFMA